MNNEHDDPLYLPEPEPQEDTSPVHIVNTEIPTEAPPEKNFEDPPEPPSPPYIPQPEHTAPN